MSASDPGRDLQALAAQADTEVRERKAHADAAAEKAARPARQLARKALALVLAGGCAAALAIQLPRVGEPYLAPDPAKVPAVAEADLAALADFVRLYQVGAGRLPESLDEVGMPPAMRALVAGSGIVYRTSGDGFSLQWTLPQWQVQFDSASGKTRTRAVSP